MDEIILIVEIGLISLVIIIILKQYKQEFAIYISIITGLIIIYMVINRLEGIINLLKTISNKSGINNQFLELLLKITGIAFLTEFAINLCKDAGENAIASKIEIGSKVVIVSMSIPIISSLLEIITKLI